MTRKTTSLGKNLATEKLSQLDLKAPVFVGPKTNIFTVLEKMRAAKSGCALIQDGKTLKGIFTERDLLTRVIEAKTPLDAAISKVMTADPKTLSIDSTVGIAIQLMIKGGYRNIPLTAGGKQGKKEVIRVLSVRDLVKYFGSNFPSEVYNLPPDPHQVQTAREGA